jgi:hypothetical protein
MIFTAPLGLLALLAIPAIVAIHLSGGAFLRALSPVCFSGKPCRQTAEGGARVSKLPITASLILECLAALALALLLAGARVTPQPPRNTS